MLMSSPYDAFAWFYDRYWAEPFQQWQEPALEQLLYSGLPADARVLDLCCGTGQLARRLLSRGYRVTAVDSSQEMLHYAQRNAPDALCKQADAADFTVPEPVEATVCTFDSVNHWTRPGHMEGAFACVHQALEPGGRFVFDINTDAAYGERWEHTACLVEPDHAFVLRGGFDPVTRVGSTEITLFRLLDHWQRWDVAMQQRPCSVAAIREQLHAAGFVRISAWHAIDDLRMDGHYGLGRVYFQAWKSSSPDARQ